MLGGGTAMKITDLKCAVIGKNPIVRIVTDAGIRGYGEAESYKPYLKPFILQFREALIGEDPTDVERCMLKHPPARRLQALWRAGQRDRTCPLGHRGQGGRRAGLQAPGRQGPRPGPHLQRRRCASRCRR